MPFVPQYIAKLPEKNEYPAALVEQIENVFDVLDKDGDGYLETKWDSSELSSNAAKRLLMDLGVDCNSFEQTYAMMKELDTNGDGKVSILCTKLCSKFSVILLPPPLLPPI